MFPTLHRFWLIHPYDRRTDRIAMAKTRYSVKTEPCQFSSVTSICTRLYLRICQTSSRWRQTLAPTVVAAAVAGNIDADADADDDADWAGGDGASDYCGNAAVVLGSYVSDTCRSTS